MAGTILAGVIATLSVADDNGLVVVAIVSRWGSVALLASVASAFTTMFGVVVVDDGSTGCSEVCDW